MDLKSKQIVMKRPISAPDKLRRSPDEQAIVERRLQDFALFKEIAARRWASPQGGAAHDRMAQRHGYYLSAGRSTRNVFPGRDRVELFYGSRNISDGNDPSSEQGAILSIVQGVDGLVSLYLQPAEVDGVRNREDAILLDRFGDTARLTGPGYLERKWRDFRAYAETTSIDGEPTLRHKARALWLRLTRPTITDKRCADPELRRAAPQIMTVLLAFLIGAVFF